jgi:predicted RNase H-like HicB family nuclease
VTTRHFAVLLEWDQDDRVWVSYVPALNHLSTYGTTREEALARTKEAITGYLEAADKENIRVPESEPETELVQLEIAV